jgi:hypothetical protein
MAKKININLHMCHVNGGGTFVLILIELCLLEHNIIVFLNYTVYWKRITFTNKIVRQCMARIQRKNVNKIIKQCMAGIQRKNVNKKKSKKNKNLPCPH